MTKACVVLTTIFDPVVLEAYYRNFERFGRLDQVEVIVIPDRKTPAAAWERCSELTRRGLRAVCPTLDEQELFLAKLGLPGEFIPYNSDNRRNIGYLMALERDCDFVISLDDDNYARDGEDVFQEHSVVTGPAATHQVLEAETGFYNICTLLQFEKDKRDVFPRGYPFFARHAENAVAVRSATGPIHVNAGLWLLDPDVEALTWLVLNPHVASWKGEASVLGQHTWSPVNTQNTSLRREALAAYYFLRMGYPIGGTAIDRYGDIFSGYFVQACVKHLGGLVRVGSPVAEHRRNTHNYMKDAIMEWGAILVLEELLPWIRERKLSGSGWVETYRSLSAGLEELAGAWQGPAWKEHAGGYLRRIASDMNQWAGVCETISGTRRGR
jgi:glycosyltransferase involved in cell wall biosynthesis